MNYYDPMFYISSEKMPFTINIEVRLRQEKIDGEALTDAINTAIQRYPYYAIQVEKRTITIDGETKEELIAVPNERPIVVYPGPEVYPLGSKEVNYHMLALSYEEDKIYFYASHVITDGSGYYPYIKTVLYYYLCKSENIELDPEDIRLAGDPFYEDELGNPFPEEKMAQAIPLGKENKNDYFRLRDGGYVKDDKATVYRLRLNKEEILDFSDDNDGSPAALISSMMAKAIWSLHPEEEKDIVSALSFNLRPGLGNGYSHRLLCSALNLNFPNKVKTWGIWRLCTVSRTQIALKSHPDNVLSYAQKLRRNMEKLLEIPTVEEKKKVLGEQALEDSISNTFSVSYVGKIGLGSLEPYIESIYNQTDGSTYQTLFIEVSAVNESFDVAFLQGFSSDVYYQEFLNQLNRYDLNYIEEEPTELKVPEIELP